MEKKMERGKRGEKGDFKFSTVSTMAVMRRKQLEGDRFLKDFIWANKYLVDGVTLSEFAKVGK